MGARAADPAQTSNTTSRTRASESGEPRAGLAASHGPTGTPEYDGDQHASNTLPIPP